MTIWFALIIPVLFAIVALVYFRKRLAAWEPFIPVIGTLLVIIFFRYIGVSSLTKDNEYWGNYVVEVRWYQHWDEWIEQQCSYDCNCSTDKDGTTHCQTCYYDCSYRRDHPEYWSMILNDGSEITISESYYNVLKKRFGTPSVFVNMNRDFYRIDGDMYMTKYPNTYAAFEYYALSHTYTNKVQASTSIFNYPEVTQKDKDQYKLYEYPTLVNDRLNAILTTKSTRVTMAEQKRFDYINGKLGLFKQVRVWVCIFNSNDDRAGFMQEAYWKRGNKNELVICIGVDKSNTVTWTRVFGWSKEKLIDVETRNYVLSQKKLNLDALGTWLYPEIDSKWKRTSFKEFEYLSIDPPQWAITWTWIISLLLCVGTYVWIIKNEFDE